MQQQLNANYMFMTLSYEIVVDMIFWTKHQLDQLISVVQLHKYGKLFSNSLVN